MHEDSSAGCCPAVAVAVVWYCSGLGYVMSVMLEPQNSMVASVAIVLVLGGFFNGVEPRFRTLTPTMKAVFGAPRYHLQAKSCHSSGCSQWSLAASAGILCSAELYPLRLHEILVLIGQCTSNRSAATRLWLKAG